MVMIMMMIVCVGLAIIAICNHYQENLQTQFKKLYHQLKQRIEAKKNQQLPTLAQLESLIKTISTRTDKKVPLSQPKALF